MLTYPQLNTYKQLDLKQKNYTYASLKNDSRSTFFVLAIFNSNLGRYARKKHTSILDKVGIKWNNRFAYINTSVLFSRESSII